MEIKSGLQKERSPQSDLVKHRAVEQSGGISECAQK